MVAAWIVRDVMLLQTGGGRSCTAEMQRAAAERQIYCCGIRRGNKIEKRKNWKKKRVGKEGTKRKEMSGKNAPRLAKPASVVDVAVPEALFHTGEGGCESGGRASRALVRWGVGPATKLPRENRQTLRSGKRQWCWHNTQRHVFPRDCLAIGRRWETSAANGSRVSVSGSRGRRIAAETQSAKGGDGVSGRVIAGADSDGTGTCVETHASRRQRTRRERTGGTVSSGTEFGRAGRHLGIGGQLGAITCAGVEEASVAFGPLMGRPRNALDEVWEPVKASSRNIAHPKKKFPAFWVLAVKI
ncbi:hypothetical protein C8R44DRAFT_948949 [Mycena epipterygia]|nr:hypothetical protein C8R44DRAFT_948949 [Mycena epipterygia]